MRPINYFKTSHVPVLSVADDGFGNLIPTSYESVVFNADERTAELLFPEH